MDVLLWRFMYIASVCVTHAAALHSMGLFIPNTLCFLDVCEMNRKFFGDQDVQKCRFIFNMPTFICMGRLKLKLID